MKEEELKDKEPIEGAEPKGMIPVEGKDEPEGSKGEDGNGDKGDDDDKPIIGGGSNGLPVQK